MTAVTMGTVVAALEGTVVTSAMPTIARELGGLASYGWVFSSFLLASTLTMLVCGNLADAFGRRPVFMAGMALFLVGSALCGSATSFGGLVAFRILQGLGAGTLQPMSMTISGDLYSLQERARVQAFSTAAWGLANVLGPLLGGWLVEHASWRWVFLVNVPVGVGAVLLLVWSYRDPARPARGPIGVGGPLLAGATATLIAFTLSPEGQHGAALGWAGKVLAVAGVGLVVLHQRKSRAPLLAMSAIAQPAVQAGLAAGICLGGLLFACSAYVPLWVISRGRGDGLAAGATLVPLLVGWAGGSAVSVRRLVARGMRVVMTTGFATTFVGGSMLAAVIAVDGRFTWVMASLAVMGFGMGSVAIVSVLGPQSCVPWADRGAVTSAVFASRMLGGSISVAALGTLGGDGHEVLRFAALAVIALVGMALTGTLAQGLGPIAPNSLANVAAAE